MNSHAPKNSFEIDTEPSVNSFACHDILGMDVADLTQNEALALMHERISNRDHTKISFLNAHNANVAKSDAAFNAAIGNFLLLADGFGVDIASKFLHGRKFKANLNGTDFIPVLLKSTKQSLKIGLYGAKPGIADGAAETFMKLNRDHEIRVVGHGYIDEAQQTNMLTDLEGWRPDLLLVALGVPRQELWIANNITEKHCTLAFGIGALFDFAAGNVRRAPKLVRALRMEWAYRLANEPMRLGRRYLLGNPLFLARVMQYKFTSKRSNGTY